MVIQNLQTMKLFRNKTALLRKIAEQDAEIKRLTARVDNLVTEDRNIHARLQNHFDMLVTADERMSAQMSIINKMGERLDNHWNTIQLTHLNNRMS